MASDFISGFDEARSVFDRASELLGFDVAARCADPVARLDRTDIAQPCLLTAEIAMLESLRVHFDFAPRFFGGHSLGEFSALVAAGVLPFDTALELVQLRGQLMRDAAPPGTGDMVAVTMADLPHEEIATLAADSGIEVANFNSAEQIVVSGDLAGLERWRERMAPLVARGAQIVPLELGVAFHSRCMAPVADALSDALRAVVGQIDPTRAGCVVSNFTGGWYGDSTDAVIEGLANQARGAVHWRDNMACLRRDGGDAIVEIGPRAVLGRFFAAQGCAVPAIVTVEDARSQLAAAAPGAVKPPAPKRAAATDQPPAATQNVSRRCNAAPGVAGATREAVCAVLESSGRAVEQYFKHQARILDACASLNDAERVHLLTQLVEANSQVTRDLLGTQRHVLANLTEAADGDAPLAVAAHPTPAPADTPLEHTSLTQLKAEIARITGFPVSALDASMEFERDLGLDSITLFEIFAAMCDRYPELQHHAGRLTAIRAIRSLGDAAAVLAQLDTVDTPAPTTSGPALPSAASPPSRAAEDDRFDRLRHELVLRIGVISGADATTLPTDADLEDELGVGVFEIEAVLAAVVERWPALGVVGHQALRARTIDELLGVLGPFLPPEAEAAPIEADAAPGDTAGEWTDDDTTIIRYTLTLEPAPQSGGPVPDRVLLVSPDDTLHERLAEELAADGCEVRRLISGPDGWTLPAEQDSPHLDLGRQDTLERALTAERTGTPPPAILFSACGDGNALSDDDADRWQDELERAGDRLLLLAQALERTGTAASPGFKLGVLGVEGQCAALAAARGAARVLAREWTEAVVRPVWLERPPSAYPAARLLDALFRGESELHLTLPVDGPLRRGRAVAMPGGCPDAELPAIEDAHLLFVGGGGVAEVLAVHLAERYGCRIGFIGRTPMPGARPYGTIEDDAELRAQMLGEVNRDRTEQAFGPRYSRVVSQRALWRTRARVVAAGGGFAYAEADATDKAALLGAVAELERGLGPVRGLMLTAGTLADAPVGRKSLDSFRGVLHTKALPAYWLYRRFRDAPLDFAFLFSSQSAFVGRPGQIDYGAANEVLNEVAAQWNRVVAYPVRALLWSLWTESGLVQRSAGGTAVARRLRLAGITNEIGAELFERELAAREQDEDWVMLSSPQMLRRALNGELAAAR